MLLLKKIKYGIDHLLAELTSKEDYWHVRIPARSQKDDCKKVYYLRMEGKSHYPGELQKGVPVFYYNGIYPTIFHTTVFNYALGLLERKNMGENVDKDLQDIIAFIRQEQTPDGGWIYHFDKNIHHFLDNHIAAMTQGLAISFISRCIHWGLIEQKTGLDIIIRAKSIMMKECIGQHWDYNTLEEYYAPGDGVLNGGLFALIGLYDYAILTNDFSEWEKIELEFRHILPHYQFGSWSYYDSIGTISSCFYHQLHIDLLNVMYNITSAHEYAQVAQRWNRGLGVRHLYILIKGFQKLLNINKMEMSYASKQ